MVKTYLTCCIGGIIFLSFARFFAPRGKNGDALRCVISVITVAVIVLPVVGFIKNGTKQNSVFNAAYYEYEGKIAEKTDIYSLKIALRLGGVEYENVLICYDESFKIKCVSVFFKKSVIERGGESINISEKVVKLTAETLGVNEEAVKIEILP